MFSFDFPLLHVPSDRAGEMAEAEEQGGREGRERVAAGGAGGTGAQRLPGAVN